MLLVEIEIVVLVGQRRTLGLDAECACIVFYGFLLELAPHDGVPSRVVLVAIGRAPVWVIAILPPWRKSRSEWSQLSPLKSSNAMPSAPAPMNVLNCSSKTPTAPPKIW